MSAILNTILEHPIGRAIVEPWQWEASLSRYWPIIVEGALVAVALGLIGCFLVVRGMSLLGDALSHSVLPGIVIGYLISVKFGAGSLQSPWILVGATAVGILAASLVQLIEKQSRIKEDASLGIVFTTMFALGVVMINVYAKDKDLDPGCVLYGNIEHFVIQQHAIVPMAMILLGIVVGLITFYRHLLVTTFDPALAISLGIPATLIHYILMASLSLTVVASFEAVGAILAVALLIMPGATARLWTDRMPWMLVLAAVHGIVSSVLGYWLSHDAVINTSASGAMTVAGFGLFIVSWLAAPKRGLITQTLARWRLNRTIATENLIKTIDELSQSLDQQSIAKETLVGEMRMPPKVFERTLKMAIKRGFVREESGRLLLTPPGRQRSQRLTRAHVLWEQFLQQQVGLPADHVHDAAEWIEHHLSDEEVEKIGQALGRAT